MYNTDDVVNGVSTLDCFNCLLEIGFDSQEKYEDRIECFSIIRKCMGIDFSIPYSIDKVILYNLNYSEDIIDSYEVNSFHSLESAKAEIKRNFKEFGWMVRDGKFNPEYLKFLEKRLRIVTELCEYSDLYKTAGENSYNYSKSDEEETKMINEVRKARVMLDNSKDTKRLLEDRIEEVKRSLEESPKLTKTM